jgi:hypothetical protein
LLAKAWQRKGINSAPESFDKKFYGTLSLSLSDAKYTALDGVERRSDWDNRYIINSG